MSGGLIENWDRGRRARLPERARRQDARSVRTRLVTSRAGPDDAQPGYWFRGAERPRRIASGRISQARPAGEGVGESALRPPCEHDRLPHAPRRPRPRSQTRSARWATYALVYLLACAVYALVGWPHTHPPYMDAYYYVDIARNLGQGRGFTENFVWNYLSGTPSLPHPSSEYWLPGLAVLLAPVYALGAGYHGVVLAMAALAALCPLLAALIGYDLFGSRRHAVTMAGLTLFNGIWFHDWTSPDAFVLYAVLATLTLLLAYRGLQGRGPLGGGLCYALAGLTAGLAALTRQEGVLLLVALLPAVLLRRTARRRLWPAAVLAALALFGLAELPWVLHNIAVLGGPAASGGNRTLWMRSYDSFYALRTANLTPRAYLAWGIGAIAGARLHAILFTLTSWLFLWLLVLAPPLFAGLWQLRRRIELGPFLWYWASLALAMPLLFTATIENGTLGHASAALVPFGSALVVAGLDTLAMALARRRMAARPREPARLARSLNALALTCAVLVSVYMTVATFPAHGGGDEYTRDAAVVRWLHEHNRGRAPVMVLDPPAFAYIDDGPYVVAPSDGIDAALSVARHYGVVYWAIDPIHARAQDALYGGRVSVAGLRRVATVDAIQLYKIGGNRAAGHGR